MRVRHSLSKDVKYKLDSGVKLARSTLEDAGYGVFLSKKEVKKGDLVFISKGVALPSNACTNNQLENYVYQFDDYDRALCIGYGSYLNDGRGVSDNIAVDMREDLKCRYTMWFFYYATKDIEKGEELFLDYDGVDGDG